MTRFLMCSTLAASLLAAQGGSQQDPAFRSTGNTVPVYVTVTDKSNRLVTSLTRDDFQALDRGKVQPLTVFDNTPQPIHLIVMLDVSGSMFGNLPLLRAACEQLFTRLRPDDMARVGAFGKEIDISPTFTHDADELIAALPTAIEPDAPTPLWRALDDAMTAFKGVQGRRVILLLSDGKDSNTGTFGQRFIGQLDIVDRAQREEVMIYGVGFRSRNALARMPMPGGNLAEVLAADLPDPGLGTVALETGGGYFDVRPRDDLGAAFARVVDELHSQYLLGFTPSALDGKMHKIEVRVTAKDVKARARSSYLAPKGSK